MATITWRYHELIKSFYGRKRKPRTIEKFPDFWRDKCAYAKLSTRRACALLPTTKLFYRNYVHRVPEYLTLLFSYKFTNEKISNYIPCIRKPFAYLDCQNLSTIETLQLSCRSRLEESRTSREFGYRFNSRFSMLRHYDYVHWRETVSLGKLKWRIIDRNIYETGFTVADYLNRAGLLISCEQTTSTFTGFTVSSMFLQFWKPHSIFSLSDPYLSIINTHL